MDSAEAAARASQARRVLRRLVEIHARRRCRHSPSHPRCRRFV